MTLLELFVIAVGLSMDAFAVAVCKGLSVPKVRPAHALTCGVYFGLFQGLMPLLGWLLGVRFQHVIVSVDHWIAFVLLGLIGLNMIRECRCNEEEEVDDSFGVKSMFLMAVATSIDALAVGIPFPSLKVNIAMAATFIGVTTFIFSAFGVKIGNVFGMRFKKTAEFAGGVILVLLGTKILLEHLGVL